MFIHRYLLWFAAFAVIPIVLHFLLRGQPKKLLFPALRLIQQRRKQNVQRMRLKHIWLMLLRIAVIVALVLALARPRVPPANYWPNFTEWAVLGVLAGLVAGLWWGLTRRWQKARLPAAEQGARRWMLGSGLAAAAIVLALLFVVWPITNRVLAEFKDPQPAGLENIPVAAVLLFDTSPSMQYRQAGLTRLEEAQNLATELIRQLPSGSKVAVGDTTLNAPLQFLTDPAAAQTRLTQLEIRARVVALNDRLRTAFETHRQDRLRTMQLEASVPEAERRDSFVREVYVFTDLSPAGWEKLDADRLRTDLAQHADFNLYLMDVSVPNPVDVGLNSVQVPERPVTQGADLHVQATVAATGQPKAQATVELYLQAESGKLVKQDQASLSLDGETAQTARFFVRGVTGQFRQGELRLTGSDPLPFDDVHYFTVEVTSPKDILLVADREDDALLWKNALAPLEVQQKGRVPYRCTVVTPAGLSKVELPKFASVCLINVSALTVSTWNRLADYVTDGGGLGVFLGSEQIDPVSYNSDAAQRSLPAKLAGYIALTPPEFLDLRNTEHPLLKKFADWGEAELTSVSIRKIWRVEPNEKTLVVAPYTDPRHLPAIIDQAVGRGRTVLFTTSVSGNDWNDLHLSWPYVAISDQLLQYLMSASIVPVNYVAGEDVLIKFDPSQAVQNYLLRKPSLQQLPGEVPAGKTTLLIHDADQAGHYRVLSADPNSSFERGFSVNPSPRESLLAPLAKGDLDQLLGENRYNMARNWETLEKRGSSGKPLGLEVFPWLALALWLAFLGEHWVANRFHDSQRVAAPA